MADLTISIPPEHVEGFRDGLLHIYSGIAEALQRAAGDFAARHDGADDLRGYRVELADLEDVLEQIGWDYEPAEEAIELTGHPELLTDVLESVVIQAAEAFDEAMQRCRRNQTDTSEIQSALRFLSASVGLFVAVHDDSEAS